MFGAIRAILFDLDETLVDAQLGLLKAHERITHLVSTFFTRNRVNVDHRVLLSKIKLMEDRMNRERQYNRDLWWSALLAEVEPKLMLPKDFVHRLTIEYWNTYSENSPPYPDTISTLEYLKQRGYKLGLVSDTDGTPGIKSSRICGLTFREFFSTVIIAGEDTVELKPNPIPFLKALEVLGISNEQSVFVGDKPFADIDGAKAARMKTILVWRRDWESDVKADVTIRSLSELLGIF